MAGVAYLLLPISGAIAYFTASDARTRFHGLQAILLGLLWPLALIVCSQITPGATQLAAAAGAIVWLTFMVLSALGLDPRIPLAGKLLRRLAEGDPTGRTEAGV
jgi:uncharacterized membrane protein